MKKIFILIFFLIYSLNSNAHMAHYNKFNKVEMEILKDGEVINSGDHEFLINSCDEYKTLYKKQLK